MTSFSERRMINGVGPERRRRRPAVSCSLCRRRKIRCNRENPCSNCVKSKNEPCVYENDVAPQPQQHLGSRSRRTEEFDPANTSHGRPSRGLQDVAGSQAPSSTTRSVAASPKGSWSGTSHASASEVESMKSTIKRLEEELAKTTQTATPQPPQPTPGSNIETTTSQIAGTFHINHGRRLDEDSRAVSRNLVIHKSRLFGASHWSQSASMFREVFATIEPYIQQTGSKAISGMKRCKDLARVIKAQRTPPWPTLPTTDLPSKGVADELLDCYLRTVETTFRILHIPTFKTEYDALWVSGAGPSMAFTVQLKLILAIGAITYDARFSLRSSAIRWVYEAHTWLSDPDFKPRLNIQCLQSRILLLIARETINVSGDSIWISAGALLRTAMHMGMHRDPSHLPTRSKLAAEMRRRLWNTILELSLQASIMAGGAPLISTDDFDCEMPGNFDDDQLLADEPTPKSDNDYTQTSIARELRKMYPQRLAIARFLNDLTSYSTFEQTLRLDTQLRASYRAICKNLRGYKPNGNGRSMSQFETRTLDFIVHYYLCCLHLPFFEPPTGEEAAYAFSRKVAVESAIKIWYAIYPSPPIGTTTPTGRDDSVPAPEQDDMTRFVSCGFGFFRTGTMVATMLVSSELRAQLQDDDSLAPSPFRHDLFAVLTDAKDRFWDMIECGETNVKGFVLTSIVLARVEGLVQGLDANKFPEVLLRAAEQAEERCIAFMEDKAAQRYNAVNVDAAHEIPGNTSPFVGDWDCIMSDTFFNFGTVEPISWVLNDETRPFLM